MNISNRHDIYAVIIFAGCVMCACVHVCSNWGRSSNGEMMLCAFSSWYTKDANDNVMVARNVLAFRAAIEIDKDNKRHQSRISFIARANKKLFAWTISSHHRFSLILLSYAICWMWMAHRAYVAILAAFIHINVINGIPVVEFVPNNSKRRI